jgi:predicted amidohydrolase YtcJ
MFCHSTNTASFFSVLMAALIFSLSLAGVASAQDNTSFGTGALQNNARGSYTGAADLIVIGDVYTMDASAPKAEAIAVAGGRLVFVGDARRARALLRRGGRTIKLAPGQTVLPGFVDSHVHMIEGGVQQRDCPIQPPEPKTYEELAAAIEVCAAALPPEKAWLIGNGWAAALFDKLGPRKEDLDALVPDRPAVIYEDGGHSAWLNSAAFLAAGIGPDTEDPLPNGRIERQPGSREPSGTLREQPAMDLVEAHIPQRTDEEYADALAIGQRHLHGFGITLVQDAQVNPRFLAAYHAAATSGVLTMKVVAAQETDPLRPASQVDELIERSRSVSAGRLTASSAKIFLDGVLEGSTAALLEPYEGSDDRGTPNWSASALTKIALRLDAAGFQIHMHGIGDRAIREGLDALAAVRAANGPSDLRHHIAHVELVDPADIPRFAELGVFANFQPFWMFADASIEQSVEPLIGPERTARLYEIRSFEQAGTRIVAGSDWPVSTANPFLAIQVGMTRRDPMDANASVWNPAQRVSLDTLLRAYTIEGATLNHRERDTGSLEVGKAADFIILDRDLFAIPPEDIGETRVLATFVDGVQVHAAAD